MDNAQTFPLGNLPSVGDADDAAFEFAEHAVGRLHFRANWERSRGDHIRELPAWLKRYGYSDVTPADVTERLDALAAAGSHWES